MMRLEKCFPLLGTWQWQLPVGDAAFVARPWVGRRTRCVHWCGSGLFASEQQRLAQLFTVVCVYNLPCYD